MKDIEWDHEVDVRLLGKKFAFAIHQQRMMIKVRDTFHNEFRFA